MALVLGLSVTDDTIARRECVGYMLSGAYRGWCDERTSEVVMLAGGDYSGKAGAALSVNAWAALPNLRARITQL